MIRTPALLAAAALICAAAAPAFACDDDDAPSLQPAFEAIVDVQHEPLFADIIRRAAALKTQASALADDGALPAFQALQAQALELSALDLKGHLDLKARGVDGDLKCILRGISEDLPRKVEAVSKNLADAAARRRAVNELVYLLDDNVGVITAPPKPPV